MKSLASTAEVKITSWMTFKDNTEFSIFGGYIFWVSSFSIHSHPKCTKETNMYQTGEFPMLLCTHIADLLQAGVIQLKTCKETCLWNFLTIWVEFQGVKLWRWKEQWNCAEPLTVSTQFIIVCPSTKTTGGWGKIRKLDFMCIEIKISSKTSDVTISDQQNYMIYGLLIKYPFSVSL